MFWDILILIGGSIIIVSLWKHFKSVNFFEVVETTHFTSEKEVDPMIEINRERREIDNEKKDGELDNLKKEKERIKEKISIVKEVYEIKKDVINYESKNPGFINEIKNNFH